MGLSLSLVASWIIFNAQVAPELGRNVSKILRFGRSRTNVGVDLFNLFNTNAVSQYLQTCAGNGATWLQPSGLVSARFAKLSVQIDF